MGIGAWAGLTAPALGQATDVELLRPSFGLDSFVGVEVPRVGRMWEMRAGTVMQLQRGMIVPNGEVLPGHIRPAIQNRLSMVAGASVDAGPITTSVSLPGAASWGLPFPGFSTQSAGLGDLSVAMRASLRTLGGGRKHDHLNVGLRGAVLVPTGRRFGFLGDGGMRASGGALVAAELWPVTLAVDMGLMTQARDPNQGEIYLSPLVTAGAAMRVKLPAASRMALHGQVVGRTALSQWGRGWPGAAVEALVGADFYPSRAWTVAVNGGRRITPGVGSTDLRVVAQVTWSNRSWLGKREAPGPLGHYRSPPPPPGSVVFDEFLTGCVFTQTIIRIRDVVEFYPHSVQIRPASLPILREIVDLVTQTPEIGLLVIEGHASGEGSEADEYALAEARARRVWEVMLSEGVAYQRLAYRAAGRVQPLIGIVGDESLTEPQHEMNRRVEFHIEKELEVDEIPEYPDRQFLPWSGEMVDVVKPPLPEPTDFEEFDEFVEFDCRP